MVKDTSLTGDLRVKNKLSNKEVTTSQVPPEHNMQSLNAPMPITMETHATNQVI